MSPPAFVLTQGCAVKTGCLVLYAHPVRQSTQNQTLSTTLGAGNVGLE
jgi:hypothetical protein